MKAQNSRDCRVNWRCEPLELKKFHNGNLAEPKSMREPFLWISAYNWKFRRLTFPCDVTILQQSRENISSRIPRKNHHRNFGTVLSPSAALSKRAARPSITQHNFAPVFHLLQSPSPKTQPPNTPQISNPNSNILPNLSKSKEQCAKSQKADTQIPKLHRETAEHRIRVRRSSLFSQSPSKLSSQMGTSIQYSSIQ